MRPTLPSTFRESERGGFEGAVTDLAVRHVSYTRTHAHTRTHKVHDLFLGTLRPARASAELANR
jgi:hypothetical protein